MSIRDWKQFTPFYFYTPVAAGLGGAAIISESRPASSVSGLLVCGFLSWALVEYVLHRFLFHYSERFTAPRQLFNVPHQVHHDHPQAVDKLFSSLRMSAPIALCYWLLAWFVLGGWQLASYLFIGLIGGYFGYEFLHYQAHHGAPRLRPFKYLRKYHLLHHHQTPDLRFGVTSPVIDYMCGTFQSVGERASRAKERLP